MSVVAGEASRRTDLQVRSNRLGSKTMLSNVGSAVVVLSKGLGKLLLKNGPGDPFSVLGFAGIRHVLFMVLTLFTLQLQAQNQRILPADFNADKEQQMMRAYLRELCHEALDARLEELKALETPEQIAAYQKRRREILNAALGPMPDRTPLNAQVTGKLDGDGFHLEKVIYESQPGFHVTGNLYIPQGDGPFPAILHPCGHSSNGKAADVYQKASMLLAQSGFVVLCYDPIGQGERLQLLNRLKGSGEHNELGAAPILLSRDLASYMVWDAVRSLDYLESRPEVDVTCLGCTGNSGGGNMTSYMMAYDERIAAAAPGCFMTTHRFKNEKPGPGDAEQNLFAQIRDEFDHPDFILTRAPKPTLILAATHDFVPIEGSWVAFRQAKQLYGKLGFPERIQLVEANEKHGFSKPLR
ncbi:MAG: acetylxylan esterase, partial [Verrucomicrobiota bacterium]